MDRVGITLQCDIDTDSDSDSCMSTDTIYNGIRSPPIMGLRRAFLQEFENDSMPPENALVTEELKLRSIPIISHTTEEIMTNPLPLERTDLVVGDFTWTRTSLKQLGVKIPEPPDYPKCLEHLLHRQVWKSTLADVQILVESAEAMAGALATEGSIFIKPLFDTKAFSGLVASSCWMEYLLGEFGADFPVLCSEIIEIVSEFRVYVVNGNIRSVCHYKGLKNGEGALDLSVVHDAVQTLQSTQEEGFPLAGYAIDFAVFREPYTESAGCKEGHLSLVTGLVEVNDGLSLGAYEGISGKDYTDLLIARWEQLMQQCDTANTTIDG